MSSFSDRTHSSLIPNLSFKLSKKFISINALLYSSKEGETINLKVLQEITGRNKKIQYLIK